MIHFIAALANMLAKILLNMLIAAILFALFWLFPLKILTCLGSPVGHASPCPATLAFLVDNPLRIH